MQPVLLAIPCDFNVLPVGIASIRHAAEETFDIKTIDMSCVSDWVFDPEEIVNGINAALKENVELRKNRDCIINDVCFLLGYIDKSVAEKVAILADLRDNYQNEPIDGTDFFVNFSDENNILVKYLLTAGHPRIEYVKEGDTVLTLNSFGAVEPVEKAIDKKEFKVMMNERNTFVIKPRE